LRVLDRKYPKLQKLASPPLPILALAAWLNSCQSKDFPRQV
jgi:hypothetical protein